MMKWHFKSIVLIVLQSVLIVTIPADAEPYQPSSSFKTEGKFRQTLDLRISGNWKNAELRQVLRRLSAEREIAVILDCRVDPNQKIEIEANNLSLKQILKKIASHTKTSVSITSNTVYLGPQTATAKLRTLVAFRAFELAESSTTQISKERRRKLTQRSTLQWNDLTTPREVLSLIARRYKLKVRGVDQIQHDLWAGATLPHANTAEALSIVLIQCDRTFAWTKNGQEIQIVDIPQKVVVPRTYSLRKSQAKQKRRLCQAKLPEVSITLNGTNMTVIGTMEQHDKIDALLHPERYKNKSPEATDVDPIEKRLFTLSIKNVPAIALMNQLKKSGIQFQYDATLFKNKGIDFSQSISMDVKKANADDFFSAMLTPLGVTFEIDGVTVFLKVK